VIGWLALYSLIPATWVRLSICPSFAILIIIFLDKERLMQCAASVLVSPDFSNIYFWYNLSNYKHEQSNSIGTAYNLEFYNFYIQIIIISFFKKKVHLNP
jgi:hypothetical protein